ncbi:MAG TPA: pyridoxamine 5'-phosphate oxidase family protein [Dermatophilaceae bacterium]|nr:pyridoxamine 5'-phosphate oxidase family protein [Dermatophilaceae bacterium]
MTTWADFAADQPELADRVRQCFAIRKHATLATSRRDGSPRISGTEVQFADGEIYLGMMPGSLKALDLRTDPRLALHCPTQDPAENDPGSWLGDGKIAGRAREVSDPTRIDEAHRFAIDVQEVVHTRVGTPADHLVIESWHPERGLQRRDRR